MSAEHLSRYMENFQDTACISRILRMTQYDTTIPSQPLSPLPITIACYVTFRQELISSLIQFFNRQEIYGTVSSKITLKFYHYKNCTILNVAYLHNGLMFYCHISYTCLHIISLCANLFWCSTYLPCHGCKGL